MHAETRLPWRRHARNNAGALSASRWLAGFLLALMFFAAAPSHAGEVVIRASWSVGGGDMDAKTLRRLIAWRNGDLYLYPNKSGEIFLEVQEVLIGALPDAQWTKRPFGIHLLPVLALNDAALALGNSTEETITGTWTLTELPDGSFAVLSLEQLPEAARPAGLPAIQAMQQLPAALQSANAQTVLAAAQSLVDTGYYQMIPLLIPLLDSTAVVKVEEIVWEDGPRKTILKGSTLGVEISNILPQLAMACLDNRGFPEGGMAEWRAWWEAILATPAFPTLSIVPGPSRVVDALPVAQSWPIFSISPDGRHGAAMFSRLEANDQGISSGVRVYDLQHAEAGALIFKIPATEQAGPDPSRPAIAWGSERIACAFFEWEYDDEKRQIRVVTASRDGQTAREHVLPLRDAHDLALCSAQEGWWLTYATEGRKVFLQRLHEDGTPEGAPTPVPFSHPPVQTPYALHPSVAVVNTVHGPVVACLLEETEMFPTLSLCWMNADGTPRKMPAGYDATVVRNAWGAWLASNGDTVLASWLGPLDQHYQLATRSYDVLGVPRGEACQVADFVHTAAAPSVLGEQFVLAWVTYGETPNQLRVAAITREGVPEAVRLANAGRAGRTFDISSIGVGARGLAPLVLYLDLSTHPAKIVLKELEPDIP